MSPTHEWVPLTDPRPQEGDRYDEVWHQTQEPCGYQASHSHGKIPVNKWHKFTIICDHYRYCFVIISAVYANCCNAMCDVEKWRWNFMVHHNNAGALSTVTSHRIFQTFSCYLFLITVAVILCQHVLKVFSFQMWPWEVSAKIWRYNYLCDGLERCIWRVTEG